ncbi:hypothetical protein MPL3365_30192 [Mesorhizobium plurifarium]|uniref:Uncharacterized protein n=1 Tax=Mesorhizobium plurifarium TaxID=69974 RepID=A0A090GV23_MESPL|nr:hypothetical protein MPL3365_30192 [Mesorhizobium plurifarium]
MPAEATAKEHRKPHGRTRITNGKSTVAADGRTIWVRRLRDLIEAHEQDLGGTDNLNQAQRSLVRRAATLSVELERMEATFATAGQISAEDLDSYQRASNTLRRHLEKLGLQEPNQKRVDASDKAVVMDGIRIADDLRLHGLCIGDRAAKYDFARRIAYAVNEAKKTGEPVSPETADLAIQLGLAVYADMDETQANDNSRGVL